MGSEIQKTTSALLKQVRELILAGRKAAARTVNSIQVATCFEIGRRIVEHEQQGLTAPNMERIYCGIWQNA